MEGKFFTFKTNSINEKYELVECASRKNSDDYRNNRRALTHNMMTSPIMLSTGCNPNEFINPHANSNENNSNNSISVKGENMTLSVRGLDNTLKDTMISGTEREDADNTLRGAI